MQSRTFVIQYFLIRYSTVSGTNRRMKSERTWKAQKDGTTPTAALSRMPYACFLRIEVRSFKFFGCGTMQKTSTIMVITI